MLPLIFTPAGNPTRPTDPKMARLHTVALPGMAVEPIGSARLRELLAYWASKRPGGDGLPRRSALDPASIHTLLPLVMILEPAGLAGDYRFRLFGTECVAKFDTDLTGQTLGEIGEHGGIFDLARACDMALRESAPVLTSCESGRGDQRACDFERIVLPVAGDQGEQLFCGMDSKLAGPALRHLRFE